MSGKNMTPEDIKREANLPGSHWLADLHRVGPCKPMGYLPIETIIESGSTLEREVAIAEQHGLSWARYRENDADSTVWSGMLVVWDSQALRALLDRSRYTLTFYGWPATPAVFVALVCSEVAYERSMLRTVIAQAFGDTANQEIPSSEAEAAQWYDEDALRPPM